LRANRSQLAVLTVAQLCGCSTLIGLDRFDGASLAIDSEEGGSAGSADAGPGDAVSSSATGDADASSSAGGMDVWQAVGVGDALVDGQSADTAIDASPAGGDASQTSPEASSSGAGGDASETQGDGAEGRPGDASASSASDASAEGGAGAGIDSDSSDAGAGPLYSFTFDTSTQGWYVFWAGLGDAGASSCSVTVSTTQGDPSPGSLELLVPFNGPSQQVNLGYVFVDAADLSGRTMTMRVKLVSGLSGEATPGWALPFAQDSNYNWADNGGVNLYPAGDAGDGWTTLTMHLDHPAGNVAASYSSSSIHNVGVQFATAWNAADCSEADILIDTVVIQ
jgi:hypothetical protein